MTAHADGRRHDRDTGRALIPVEEARDRMLRLIEPLPAQERPLHRAFGCAVASDVSSPRDLPPFTSSAMDGFAVRAADVAPATADRPVGLRIVGEVRMGRPPEATVGPGEAVAIPTGGAVPQGAQCVIPVEHCVVEDDRVLVLRPEPPGRHVRPAGEDLRAGDALVPAGRRLLGPDLGLLASAGLDSVAVRPPARVVILSTGDELVGPGTPLEAGRLHDANAFTLEGAVREAGAVPVPAGIVPDDPQALVRALEEHADGADAFVTSGGVSAGERDPVKLAFAGRGEVEFLEVAMQPGKPQAFGSFGGRPLFGLPGNPVSVFVSFEVFVRPALMRMMGRREDRPRVLARLETELRGPREKAMFARVRVKRDGGGWAAASTGPRQSNLLSTASRANGLAVVPAGIEALAPGDSCEVLLFRDPGEP
ncbi:MAG: molybdopterin molybdotransferase MoeA [Actinomycetota bacterium]